MFSDALSAQTPVLQTAGDNTMRPASSVFVKSPKLQPSIDRVSQVNLKPQLDTGREDSSQLPPLEEMNVHQVSSIQIPSIFSSNEARYLKDTMNGLSVRRLCLYSFFGLEMFRHLQELKTSTEYLNLSSETQSYFEKSWITWQCSYMQAFEVFLKGRHMHSTCFQKACVANFMKKMTRLPDILRNLLKHNQAWNENIESFLGKWENCQELLTKFSTDENFLFLLRDVPLGRYLDLDNRFLSEEEVKQAMIQLRNFAAFIFETLKNMPKGIVPPRAILIFAHISAQMNVLNFDGTLDRSVYHQVVKNLADYFSYFYASREDAFVKGKQVIGTGDFFRIYDCCAFFVCEFIRELQLSILPGADPSYINRMAHEERLQMNLWNLNKFLVRFKKMPKTSSQDATDEINLLNKINNKFFNQIVPLHNRLSLIVDRALSCSQIGMLASPFLNTELQELSEQFKPAINYVLKALSGCANKFPEKLHGLPCLRMTIKIALVLLIDLDINILKGKKTNPYDLPSEYLEFIGLYNQVTDVPNSEEEEEKAEKEEESMAQVPSGSLEDIESETSDVAFSSLEANEPTFSSSAVPVSVQTVSSLRDPKSKASKCLHIKKGISLRQLNKELKNCGFERDEGRRHARWRMDNLMWMGPRHGKNPSRGLVHSVQKLAAEKGILGGDRIL